LLGVYVLVLYFYDTAPVPDDAAASRRKLRDFNMALWAFTGTLILAILAAIVALVLYYSGTRPCFTLV